jgi:hypothetical protein
VRTSVWQLLEVPYFCERIIALCVPSAARIVAMSYKGLHDIRLLPDITVATDADRAEDYDLYDVDRLTITVRGRAFPAMGLHGGSPFPTTADGLSAVCDADANTVVVKDREGEPVLLHNLSDCPPGWLAATFSADGLLFVVATPDALWCWRRSAPAVANPS